MSTDLEHDLCDALQARARSVTPHSLRYADEPRRRRRSLTGAILAAAAVVTALAVSLAVWPRDHAGDGGRPAAGPAAVPAAGTSWRLEQLWTPDGTVARPPASLSATLSFRPDRTISGDDTVNALTGRYRPTADGFEVTDSGTTFAAYAGKDRIRLAITWSMRAVFFDAGGDPVEVEARVAGDRLTLKVSGYTLAFRSEPRDDAPRPTISATATR